MKKSFTMEKDKSRIPFLDVLPGLQGRTKTACGYILQEDRHTPITKL